jgi:hypothetical protein
LACGLGNKEEKIEELNHSVDLSGGKSIDIFNKLLMHKSEYIFYRSDHHWTSLGAYYAYEEFCMKNGLRPISLRSYQENEVDGFLGTLFSAVKNNRG